MPDPAPQPARHRPPDEVAWSQVWHLPVLLLGAGLLAIGVYLAMPEPEQNQYPEALDEVAALLLAENPEEAQEELEAIRPFIDEAPAFERARYWQYWGDTNYLQLHRAAPVAAQGEAGEKANQRIAQCYAESASLDRPLDARAVRRYAETLVALGRSDEALALLDQLQGEPAQQRYQIVRRLIERHRAAGAPGGLERVTALIERFHAELRHEADPARRRAQEIWIAGVEARMQIDAGDPQRAIGFLLLRLQRLMTAPDQEDLAPLRLLLARAYQQVGDLAQAEGIYRAVQQRLDSTNPLMAEAYVGLGQIALSTHRPTSIEEAQRHFSAATANYPSVLPAAIDALIGQADCEARQQSYPESIQHFRLAVEKLVSAAPAYDDRRTVLTETVRSHIQRCADEKRYDLALEMLTLLTPLHQPDLPTELLLDFALTHERIAEQRRAYANPPADAGAPLPGRDARRLANQEASVHFAKAADYYLRHARAVTITDNDAHGQSLWSAATCFDKAERWKDAINVYAEYIRTREDDPLKLRATNHLANAYLADGQYQAAADLYLRLVEEHPHTLEAYESLVPLARAYMALDETDKAERTLLSVVSDHEALTPDSDQYQQALIELGKLYYRLGETQGRYYVSAIERLTEAVERYGKTPHGISLRFLLADAYRRSVRTLDEELAQRQAQGDRLALQAERNARLEKAQMYYNQVINLVEGGDIERLAPLEKLYYRNAYFYQADCAFDRRQYELAIDLYDQAARKWKNEPASLVALVQMVNAYCELGQYQDARVINERARSQLARMPDEAFDDPTLPMSRQHWEDWLRWTSEVELFGEAGAAPRPGAQSRR